MPALRFRGFYDAWEQRKLGQVANFFDEKRFPIDSGQRISGEYPYYGATGIIDYVADYIFDGNYILLAEDGANIIMRNSPIAYITTGKFWLNNHAHIMTMTDGSNDFLLQILENQNYEKYNSGTAQPKLNGKVVKELSFCFPTKYEQQKIGSFFKQLDNVIAQNEHKVDLLNQLKQAYLQKIFSQELRFAGFSEHWEERDLSAISDKVTEKNKENQFSETFTNSAEYGIINQRDFFDKDISNEKNLNGYYIVHENDFVYNPRISNYAPVGPIKRNKLGRTGVMSPLYYIFKSHDVDKKYLEYYFDTTAWHKFMKMNGDSGARSDRFAIKDSVFNQMPIPYPTIGEQEQIGSFFEKLDITITLNQQKLTLLKKQKQAYLQKMFI